MRESTNRFFALAFVASKGRPQLEGSPEPAKSRGADTSEKLYVTNGEPNPTPPGAGKNNIIPWQPVPVPVVDSVEPAVPPVVNLSWNNVRIVHDGSIRPNAGTSAPLVVG